MNGIHDLVYLNSEVKRESRFGCGTKKTSRWKPSETRAGLPLTCQKREFDHWNKYSYQSGVPADTFAYKKVKLPLVYVIPRNKKDLVSAQRLS